MEKIRIRPKYRTVNLRVYNIRNSITSESDFTKTAIPLTIARVSQTDRSLKPLLLYYRLYPVVSYSYLSPLLIPNRDGIYPLHIPPLHIFPPSLPNLFLQISFYTDFAHFLDYLVVIDFPRHVLTTLTPSRSVPVFRASPYTHLFPSPE